MIENVSTQLTVFHCFAHCLLPGRAFASLYALLFLEKEAEIGGREFGRRIVLFSTDLPGKSDSDIMFCLQLLSKTLTCILHLS